MAAEKPNAPERRRGQPATGPASDYLLIPVNDIGGCSEAIESDHTHASGRIRKVPAWAPDSHGEPAFRRDVGLVGAYHLAFRRIHACASLS